MPNTFASVGLTPPSTARPHARLALADGFVLHGTGFGAIDKGIVVSAEVVFNTAMCGYQESLTDPSYTGQILVQTFPLIGNYGVNPEDVESRKVQVAGFIVRELTQVSCNYRATETLHEYLNASNVLGLDGVDTRALTKRLRTTGSINGVLTDQPTTGARGVPDAELVDRAKSARSMAGLNLVPLVGCTSKSTWDETLGEWALAPVPAGAKYRVLTLDCGAKANILRNLSQRGCEVVVVPHDTSAETILGMYARKEIDGLFISNGPGDPAAVEKTIQTLQTVLAQPDNQVIPTFGICLGHQLLSLAVGAKTYKLKFGHRGANQPVLRSADGKVEITSQNHGFAVEAASLESVGGRPTHIHLNDGTLAGFEMKSKPVFAVQYHPEASPGPHDASYLFDRFVAEMAAKRSKG